MRSSSCLASSQSWGSFINLGTAASFGAFGAASQLTLEGGVGDKEMYPRTRLYSWKDQILRSSQRLNQKDRQSLEHNYMLK